MRSGVSPDSIVGSEVSRFEGKDFLLAVAPSGFECNWFYQLSRSGNDFDRRADVNQLPNIVHLFVRDGDATVRPVMQSVCLPHPRVLFRQSVQHNVTPALTPNLLAAVLSFEFGYEMWKAL